MKHVWIAAFVFAAVGCKQSSRTRDERAEPPTTETAVSSGSGDPSTPIVGGIKNSDDEKPRDKGDPEQRKGELEVLFGDDQLVAVGDIDKNAVKQTVKQSLDKLQACYEKTLLANPGIEGKVVATFRVAIDGSVREAKASGVHPDMETCVVEVIRTFKFEAKSAEVEITYPFSFRAM